MKKIIALFLVLMMVLSLAACGSGTSTETTGTPVGTTEAPAVTTEAPEADGNVLGEGATSFGFTVVDLDGTEISYEIHTDAATVGEALLALDLISGTDSEYGLYVKEACGIVADYNVDETYWAFYIDGEYALTGVDSTEVTAGASYAFVKTGPSEDTASDVTALGEGAAMFRFSVVDLEGNETKYEIHTDETTVGAALVALELVTGHDTEYGLYVDTVNGIAADWDKDQTYWAFYIDGEYALTGVDATEITENAAYSFVLTKG